MCTWNINQISIIASQNLFQDIFHHFHVFFSFKEGREDSSSKRWLVAPHGQQQFRIVLLAPHQDGAKQGQKCSRFIWSLDDLWAAFPVDVASRTSSICRGAFWTHGWSNVAGISWLGWKVVPHSRLCEFQSSTLCREVSRRELFPKISSVPLVLGIVFFQSLPKIHDYRLWSEQRPCWNRQLCGVWNSSFISLSPQSDKAHAKLCLVYRSVYQHLLCLSCTPPLGTWNSPPVAVYCRSFAAYTALGW